MRTITDHRKDLQQHVAGFPAGDHQLLTGEPPGDGGLAIGGGQGVVASDDESA